MAQGKAETLAGCLSAADGKRKAAEENLKRLEIRMGQGRQGLALLKAAKMQSELEASRQHAADLDAQLARLVGSVPLDGLIKMIAPGYRMIKGKPA